MGLQYDSPACQNAYEHGIRHTIQMVDNFLCNHHVISCECRKAFIGRLREYLRTVLSISCREERDGG